VIYSTPALSGGGLLRRVQNNAHRTEISFNIILCTKHVERFMLLALRIIARCARLSLPVVFVRTRVRVVSLFAASLHALW
jgi:hypothetical protein